ncbi:MAG TPA: Asp-tRNA(Asn)/Glu-tRNA(Gln) amidotransferase subunit GatB [Ignavibacteriales bacterium]|nr:Asp-tRNA(Asn)/Glu-tRNA(Gln) amidotransferase subunit GatB [Ignavibacteriales bacterium]
MKQEYEAVIGLEVHAQLLTDTKIFCGCSTKFGNPPNTNVCPICLGHPGVLPVLNKKVVEFAVLMGLATNCRINMNSVFARKNYFYPDLPKGYQISQFEAPICEDGFVEIELKDGTKRNIGLTRIHMEEDAGKSIHDQAYETLVDVNRCGVPLIEIVSEPDMHTPEEAYQYLSQIRQTVQYLGICDGNMEEGSLRCDANVSVRLKGETKLGTKTEVKNMNSFRNVEKALIYEIDRQIEIIEDGGRIIQETLLWDADANVALPMRSKEEAHDYRYFPEPDLMPVAISREWFEEIKRRLPELPKERNMRFISEYSLPSYDAGVLTSSRELADYYEKTISVTKDYKAASNWIMGDLLKILNETKTPVENFPIHPENLGKLINLINDNTVSGKIAKDVFQIMLSEDKEPGAIIKERNLVQITDTSELEDVIARVIESNPKDVKEFLSGKEKVIGFFVGQIMKETKGKASPKAVNEILRNKLNALK